MGCPEGWTAVKKTRSRSIPGGEGEPLGGVSGEGVKGKGWAGWDLNGPNPTDSGPMSRAGGVKGQGGR